MHTKHRLSLCVMYFDQICQVIFWKLTLKEACYKQNASSQNLPPGQDSNLQPVALNAKWGTPCSTELYKHPFLTAKYKTNSHLIPNHRAVPFLHAALMGETFFYEGFLWHCLQNLTPKVDWFILLYKACFETTHWDLVLVASGGIGNTLFQDLRHLQLCLNKNKCYCVSCAAGTCQQF